MIEELTDLFRKSDIQIKVMNITGKKPENVKLKDGVYIVKVPEQSVDNIINYITNPEIENLILDKNHSIINFKCGYSIKFEYE